MYYMENGKSYNLLKVVFKTHCPVVYFFCHVFVVLFYSD